MCAKLDDGESLSLI